MNTNTRNEFELRKFHQQQRLQEAHNYRMAALTRRHKTRSGRTLVFSVIYNLLAAFSKRQINPKNIPAHYSAVEGK